MSTIEEDTINYYLPDWKRYHAEELAEFYAEYQKQYPDTETSLSTFSAYWFYRWREEQRKLQRQRALEEQKLDIDGQIVTYAKHMGLIR